MKASNFYTWWTEKVKGRYITNEEFENVLMRFEEPENNQAA